MDLSRITYRYSNKKQKRRSHSIDDDDIDNLSNNSRSLYNIHTTASTASDSERSMPVSVREMINLYNRAARENAKLPAFTTTMMTTARRQTSQHMLPLAKSAYFGVNKFGSQTNVREFVTQVQETGEENCDSGNKSTVIHRSLKLNKQDNTAGDGAGHDYRQRLSSVRSFNEAQSESDCNKMFYIADHMKRSSRSPNKASPEFRDSKDNNAFKNISSNLKSVASHERNSLQASDSIDESLHHPVESSYQSKTTIAKTASGVRIIIDIFFDQEQQNVSATDVVGSRVETDIPQSRILTEFQQQATAAQSITQA